MVQKYAEEKWSRQNHADLPDHLPRPGVWKIILIAYAANIKCRQKNHAHAQSAYKNQIVRYTRAMQNYNYQFVQPGCCARWTTLCFAELQTSEWTPSLHIQSESVLELPQPIPSDIAWQQCYLGIWEDVWKVMWCGKHSGYISFRSTFGSDYCSVSVRLLCLHIHHWTSWSDL